MWKVLGLLLKIVGASLFLWSLSDGVGPNNTHAAGKIARQAAMAGQSNREGACWPLLLRGSRYVWQLRPQVRWQDAGAALRRHDNCSGSVYVLSHLWACGHSRSIYMHLPVLRAAVGKLVRTRAL